MRLSGQRARQLFAGERVARLATVSPQGLPHLVPVVFVLDDEHLYTAVDSKPKSTRALRRLANIAANPQVTLLADHYDEDWNQLWWARADGVASLADGEAAERALDLLAERYSQYRAERPPGPVLDVRITSWAGWSARDIGT